jgi:hypothetical protein
MEFKLHAPLLATRAQLCWRICVYEASALDIVSSGHPAKVVQDTSTELLSSC